jgi:hypothetical protein
MFPQISLFKGVANQAANRHGNDDLVRGGESVQTRGQIGRAAHRQLRLASPSGRIPLATSSPTRKVLKSELTGYRLW